MNEPTNRIASTIDVFADLSDESLSPEAVADIIAGWLAADALGEVASTVRIVTSPRTSRAVSLPLPAEWSIVDHETTSEFGDACLRAGISGRPLLIVNGAAEIGADAIGVMRQQLDRDPMYGFAVPRVGCTDRCCFARIVRHGTGDTEWVPRRVLADLPDREVFIEILAPSVLIAPVVTANFEPLEQVFERCLAQLLHYMAFARRRGFRTVLCNRAIVGLRGAGCDRSTVRVVPGLPVPEEARLREEVTDLERSWNQFRGASWQRFEKLATQVVPSRHERPTLLLDIRNVGAFYNGTTHAALGVLSGFRELATDWDIALLTNEEGAVFHRLSDTYPDWPSFSSPPDRAFTVAFRPSQPWDIREIGDLHRLALVNAYLIFDTIAWDIGYCAPKHLEGVWQFLADHADGLLFDSAFSQQRFLERFRSGTQAEGGVTHFSFAPDEYTRRDVTPALQPDSYLLVIGNDLDHKDVRQTVATLASAFPYRRVKALGPSDVISPFVTSQPSGALSDIEIHQLYARAEYVIYPSFYEGFGFPIVMALAYGRTVLARRSALIDELAAHCAGPGRLVVFDRREDLVELLGRLLHGETVPQVNLGRAGAGAAVRTWRDVASDTSDFLRSLIDAGHRRRWITRERALRQPRISA